MHVVELGHGVSSAGLSRLHDSRSRRKSQISVSIKRLRFRLWHSDGGAGPWTPRNLPAWVRDTSAV